MWGDLESASKIVKPVRRACARGSKFGQDASLTQRRARAVRAKCSLAGLTTSKNTSDPILKMRKERFLIFPLACDLVLATLKPFALLLSDVARPSAFEAKRIESI